MKRTLAGLLLGVCLASCASLDSANQSSKRASAEPGGKTLEAPITLIKPGVVQSSARFSVTEGDLWRLYVANATDDQIMGMILDDKQIWFAAPFPRTCNAGSECAGDENAWRQILIQTCSQTAQTLGLVYRDGRDNQLYRTSAARLTPSCATSGGILVFRPE